MAPARLGTFAPGGAFRAFRSTVSSFHGGAAMGLCTCSPREAGEERVAGRESRAEAEAEAARMLWCAPLSLCGWRMCRACGRAAESPCGGVEGAAARPAAAGAQRGAGERPAIAHESQRSRSVLSVHMMTHSRSRVFSDLGGGGDAQGRGLRGAAGARTRTHTHTHATAVSTAGPAAHR